MSKKLQVTELDFDNIKSNIKSFISTKPEFTDYDFEGSGLSVMLEVLAYNTYYNAVYTNVVYNESFLSTAVKYSNVVSMASEIGYTARSITSPKTVLTVSLEVAAAGTSQIIVPRGTSFTTNVDGASYTYVTLDDYTSDTPHTMTLDAYEGKLHTQIITVTDDTVAKYFIDNVDVDTKHIQINVNGISYSHLNDVLSGTPTSETYILNHVMSKTEIHFGDGVVGAALRVGDIIQIKYITTKGGASNGGTTFASIGTIGGFSVDSVVATVSSGGDDAEDIDSVKYLAPLKYASQNRMVTKNDHIVLLQSNHAIIESLNVWGGETHVPSQYGKVFVAIKPDGASTLTAGEKTDVMTTLNRYGMMSTTYEILDPDYIYLVMNIQLKYDSTETTKTKNDIRTDAISVVGQYTANNLNNFSTYFKYSDFVSKLDDTNAAIQSNITTLEIEKRHTITTLNTPLVTTVYFGNAFKNGTLTTQEYRDVNFDLVTIFDKDGIVYENVTTPVVVGSVDYNTGTINFTKLHVRALESGTTLNLRVTPVEFDIIPTLNNIVAIDMALGAISVSNVI